jgi:hypothetical protein
MSAVQRTRSVGHYRRRLFAVSVAWRGNTASQQLLQQTLQSGPRDYRCCLRLQKLEAQARVGDTATGQAQREVQARYQGLPLKTQLSATFQDSGGRLKRIQWLPHRGDFMRE